MSNKCGVCATIVKLEDNGYFCPTCQTMFPLSMCPQEKERIMLGIKPRVLKAQEDHFYKKKKKQNAKQNVNSWRIKHGNKTLEF